MRFIFCLVLSINSFLSYSQVIFSKKTRKMALTDTVSKPSSVITYMGKSVTDRKTDAQPSKLSDSQSVKSIKIDPLDVLSDSLFLLLTQDSLRLLTRRVEALKRSGIMSKRWLLRDVPSILPIRILSWSSYRVSSGFGLRYHPITDKLHNHSGIDLPQPLYTSVYATADGWVDRVVFQPQGLGLAVYLRHQSGYATVYGHLIDHSVVVGEFIERGDVIGRVGSTGLSTGPHLHYAVLDRGLPVDPADFCFLLLKAINQQTPKSTRKASSAVEAVSSAVK